MTLGIAVMLTGILIVPAALVWMGHRLRRRNVRVRGAFWGAIIGHVTAIVLGMTFGMIPPEEWMPDDRMRGAFAFWSFVVLPLVGGVIGWFSASSSSRGAD